ncbi:MAG: outer membrane beta-barrel protein [Burkholderiales bacterium]|nr:outer membrane beta-barrel protein [Burkholderiales bacterium]
MRLTAPTVISIALLAAAGGATAQTGPWYVGVAQSFGHDSNVYRVGDGVALPAWASKSDTVSTTSLVGGLDLPVGRQRLYGSASLRSSRYQDNDNLDYEGYALRLGTDWETAGRVSGKLELQADRRLASFVTDNEVAATLERNVETVQQARAVARVGVVTRLTAEAGLAYRRVDYSATAYAPREHRQTTATAGLRYELSGSTEVGAGLRHVRGEYPRFASVGGQSVADEYRRNGVDLTLRVQASGSSALDGRLTLGRTEYDQARQRDFSGATGELSWRYTPGGRWRLRTALVRDTGQETYFSGNAALDGFTDYSRRTTSLSVRGDYELTAKVALNASASLAERDLVRALPPLPGLPASVSGSDRTARLALGASWAPTRNLSLGCDLGRERRRASGGLSLPYGASSVSCFGQFVVG